MTKHQEDEVFVHFFPSKIHQIGRIKLPSRPVLALGPYVWQPCFKIWQYDICDFDYVIKKNNHLLSAFLGDLVLYIYILYICTLGVRVYIQFISIEYFTCLHLLPTCNFPLWTPKKKRNTLKNTSTETCFSNISAAFRISNWVRTIIY